MINKKELRRQIKEEKGRLSLSEIEKNSNIIINNLMATKEYKECKTIFSYVSFNQEVMTNNLIEQSFKNKKVAVPKVAGDEMNFYYIRSLDDLEAGIKGILEPGLTNKDVEAIPEEGDLFVVPGLAFDINKNRIGYGKGYYDIYFNKHSNINFYKIALAFDFQIKDQLPVYKYDIKMDEIITPTRLII